MYNEVLETLRATLESEARDKAAAAMRGCTSIGQSDGVLSNLKYAIRRIDHLTNEQLEAIRLRREACAA